MHYRIITFTVIIILIILGNPLSAQDIALLEKDFRQDLKKALQYPKNEERLARLSASYQAVTSFDEDAVKAFRTSGQPDIWYHVFRIYEKMDERQQQMMTLPEPALQKLGFVPVDYSEDLLESLHKAEAYLYAHARKLLESGDPEAARQAYLELVKLARISGGYKDLDEMLRKAVMLGATHIEYELYNKTGKTLNEKIVDQLSVAITIYRDQRQEKTGPAGDDKSFPFIIRVYLTELKVSPDRVKELSYDEERDIYRDGVVVDTIRCHVEQFKQVKGAVLSGRIDIYDVKMKSVINTVPVTAESMFIHSYATLKGNPDAAGEETRKMLAQRKVEFPSNESIVMDAAEEFTRMALKILLPL